ncbi:MAG: hypothetical protein KAH54_09620 [Candidatus Sabulitectum sp.]|nr:hypothetical protein [Candidatus Sabulitectum sp.]
MRFMYCVLVLVFTMAAWDFSYNINMEQIKETTSLTNSFSVSEAISPTVSLNGNGSFYAKRTDGLDQFTDSRSGSGWVSWKPIDGVDMSSTFLKSISLEDRYGSRVRDDRTESATGAIRYSRGSWLSTNTAVGIQRRDYITSSGTGNNDGNFYRVSASVNKTILNSINTSVGFNENRSYGSETNNFSDGLSARVSYYFPEEYRGGSIGAEISGDRNSVIYIDSLESHIGDSWAHSENLELPELIPGVFIDISTSWSGDRKHWESTDPDSSEADPRSDDRTGRNLSSNLIWEMAENIELDFAFSRSMDEREDLMVIYGSEESYKLDESMDDKLLNITLSYTPGRARVAFQRIVELYSYDTVIDDGDSSGYSNDYDRDEYRELLGVSASIPLSPRFTVTCSMTGQQRSSYYLMASQSANSKTASTYSFYPGYKYDMGNDWKISQYMKITANYTTYMFTEASADDRLFRRLEESFSLNRVSSDSTTLGISHRFTFNDQGTFEDDLFMRSEESINNRITVDAGFHVSEKVGLTPSYTYEYASRNRMDLSLKTVDHIHHVGIRSVIAAMGGTLNANITRTFYSNSSRDSYWNATVGFNVRM